MSISPPISRIIRSKSQSRIFISDLNIRLDNYGDEIDVLKVESYKGDYYRTLDALCNSYDLDLFIRDGLVEVEDEDGNILDQTNYGNKASFLATIWDVYKYGAGGSSSSPTYFQVFDENSLIGNATILDFVGGGVTATLSGSTATISISGASVTFAEGEGINIVSTGYVTTISAEDASSINKGVASFNSTNFSVSSGAVNTVQNIDTTANPTFFDLKISNINPNMVLVSDSNNQIKSGSTTSAQLSYLYGVTSPLQTQINSKQDTITGAASTITSSNLNPNKVVVSDTGGKVTSSSTTSTQLSYLYGVTSPLQTQLNAKEPTLTKGNLTEAVSDVLTIVGGTGSVIGTGTSIQVQQASTSTDGFLSSTDWNTFNNNTGSGSGSSTFLGLNDVANKTFLNYGLYGIRVNSGATHLEFVDFFNLFQEGEGINISKSGENLVIWGEEATSTNKGIASFNSTNLPVSDGVVNTVQDINTFSSPSFTNLTLSGLTANRSVITNASKQLESSAVTDTEIGHLSGVTSGIQSQINAKQDTITGAASTIASNNLEPNKVVVSDAGGKVTSSSTTSIQLSYLYGVTSNIQNQFSGKQDTITGAVTTVTSNNLEPNKVVVSDTSGKVTSSSTTSIQLSYLYGVTSPLQTQLNAKEPTLTKGDLTETGSDVLTITGGTGSVIGTGTTIQVQQASTGTDGFLSSVDWNTFNNTESGSSTFLNLTDVANKTFSNYGLYGIRVSADETHLEFVDFFNLFQEGEGINISKSGQNLIIWGEEASSTNKGIASFNSTNLPVTSGVVNTAQDINTSSSPTFTNLTLSGLTANKAIVSDGSKQLTSSATTDTEIGYLVGVTSGVQSQINSKQDTITGAASTITSSNLNPNKVIVSDTGGKIVAGSTTSIQLSYLYGVTSPLQTQINSKQDTITGAVTTVTSNNLEPNKVVVSDTGGKVTSGSTTSIQLSYLYGVTSSIQNQFSGKQDTITGAVTTVTSNNLEPNKVVVSDTSGKVVSGSTTSIQLSYLYGVTSPLQTQLNGKQSLDATLTALAGLSTSADQMIYSTGSDAFSMTSLTSLARTLLDDADQATAQTTLGVDPAGTDNSTDVTLAGTPDYITIVGQTITRNQIDLAADVTGTLPTGSGGTGLTSFTANGILYASDTTTLINASDFVWDGDKLGIGTASPGQKLEVEGATDVRIKLDTTGGGVGDLASIDFAANNGRNLARIESKVNASFVGDLRFYTNPTGSLSAETEKMRILGDGTVKILGLTTNGPVYTSGGDGSLNSEATLSISRGGTGLSAATQYRMFYASAANTISQTTNLTWNESILAIAGQQTITTSSAGASIDLLLRNSAIAGANVGTALGFALQSGNAKSALYVDNNSLTNGRHDLLICVDIVDDANVVAFSDAKITIKGDTGATIISGDVGVNTAPSSTNFHVYRSTSTTTPMLKLEQASTGDCGIGFSADSILYVFGLDNSDSNYLKISAGLELGTGDMVLFDTSGNVRIANNLFVGGTDLEAWSTSYSAIEMGNGSFMFHNTAGSGTIHYNCNAYFDTAWKFKGASNYALNMYCDPGSAVDAGWLWRCSTATGAADAAVTYASTMTLSKAGNLTCLGDVQAGNSTNTLSYTTSWAEAVFENGEAFAAAEAAGYWLPGSTTGTANEIVFPCPHITAGSYLKTVRIHVYDSDTVNNVWNFYVYRTTNSLTAAPSTSTVSSNTNNPPSNQKGVTDYWYQEFTTNLTIAAMDDVWVRVQPDPDTTTTTMRVYSVEWIFEARVH